MHMPTFFPHVQLSSSVYIQRKIYEFGLQLFCLGSIFAFCSVIFDIWLFCQVNFISLQSSLQHFAKCMLFNCHVHIPKLPTPHCQGNVAKLPSPLHPMDCTNDLEAPNKLQNLWDAQCLNCFWCAQTSGPKERLPLICFSHKLLPPPPSKPLFPFLLFLFVVFGLDGSLKLGPFQKFKLPSELAEPD